MKTIAPNPISYYLEVEIYRPQLNPNFAYRRSGRFAEERFRTIYCPHCPTPTPLIQVDIIKKVRTYRAPRKPDVRCDEYKTCYKCRNRIGITFI